MPVERTGTRSWIVDGVGESALWCLYTTREQTRPSHMNTRQSSYECLWLKSAAVQHSTTPSYDCVGSYVGWAQNQLPYSAADFMPIQHTMMIQHSRTRESRVSCSRGKSRRNFAATRQHSSSDCASACNRSYLESLDTRGCGCHFRLVN